MVQICNDARVVLWLNDGYAEGLGCSLQVGLHIDRVDLRRNSSGGRGTPPSLRSPLQSTYTRRSRYQYLALLLLSIQHLLSPRNSRDIFLFSAY